MINYIMNYTNDYIINYIVYYTINNIVDFVLPDKYMVNYIYTYHRSIW